MITINEVKADKKILKVNTEMTTGVAHAHINSL